MHGKSFREKLLEDLGLLAFLASVFSILAVAYLGGPKLLPENLAMLFVTVVAIVLVSFSAGVAAFVVVGSQLICYCAFKIFRFYSAGEGINAVSYLWLLLPIAAALSMRLFIAGRDRLELQNKMLSEQVEKLVMIDPLTELYNLRSFYHDLPRQISYIRRNELPLTLMIVRLRYAEELKRLFAGWRFDMIKQRLAQTVEDAIRSEDRLYSVDTDGGLAVMLTCDQSGGAVVKNRIHARAAAPGAFDNIADVPIKVDLQVAFVQYDGSMDDDIVAFKSRVENELQYDV